MKVRELIKLIETEFSIVYDNQNYNSKSTIPEKVMNDDVKSIHTENDHIIVKINDSKDVQSLENLGYSFEVGV
jgi:hypothetical protein